MLSKHGYLLFTVAIFYLVVIPCYAQDNDDLKVRFDSIEKQIRRLESSVSGLNGKVNISLTDVPLNEFLRAVANNSGVNMDIDPAINQKISNNFNDVRVSDVLIFLSRQFRLDISSINNIFIIRQITTPSPPPLCYVQFNDSTKKLTIEVEDERLSVFLKELTKESGRNVIPARDAGQVRVSSFILAMPFEEAIDKMAYANDLVSKPTADGFILIEKKPVEAAEVPNPKTSSRVTATKNDKSKSNSDIRVRLLGTDTLSVYAQNAKLADVIGEIADKCGFSYIMNADDESEVNLQISGSSIENIISALLEGSNMALKENNGIYLIGKRDVADYMTQKVIQLQYRSVDSITYAIPDDLTDKVDIRPFTELNSLFISGPADRVSAVTSFLKEIDKLVPVISIEMLIVDYSTSYALSTGIDAGIGDAAVEATTGSVFPSVNMTLSSESINDLLSRFNGLGWAKIGQVTPNFYASIKMLESQGIIRIRSTPILSTLNGHTAELSIGTTEYYLEESVNIIGTQNPTTTTAQTYKAITAELGIIITPLVSGDGQITLEVEIVQSDFTERISTTAPPGQVSRTLKSQIRVKDGEMILLGGLEEKEESKTSDGTPFLSRIPVLKWFFSSREEVNSNSKLNIFIKPSIIK